MLDLLVAAAGPAVAGAVAGGLAVFLATPQAATRPQLKPREFNLTRPEENEYIASPQKPLEIPQRYGDFDLDATVEMAADTELDVVFHRVAEWDQQGDQHVPPFHARFDVLRLSTRGEGRAFLTSEEALFDDQVAGVRVQPGRPLTVVLQARDHRARANIAGVDVAWFETRDDHGNFAFVVRGGNVVIRRLWIKPWASPLWLLPFGWGAILGGVLGGVLRVLLRPKPMRLLVALLVLVSGGLFAWALLMRAQFLVAADPSTLSTVVAGLCFLPLSILVAAPGGRMVWRVVVGVLVAVAGLEYVARSEQNHLQVFADSRLDLYFGAQSGSAPFDALARRLTNNRQIHYPLPGLGEPARYDVLFLGGELLFDYGDRRSMAGLERNVVSQVAGYLRNHWAGRRNVATAALPTQAPYSYQQVLLAERFYMEAFRPRVVVLGLSDAEAQPALDMPARRLEEILPEADAVGWSALVDLWLRELREPVPPGGADDLRLTLEHLDELCKAFDAKLVLALDRSLDPDRAAVVRRFVAARKGKVPLVDGFDIWRMPRGEYPIQRLVEVIQKLIE
jgi:hypothetical protein